MAQIGPYIILAASSSLSFPLSRQENAMVRVLRIVSLTLVLLAASALCNTAWAQPGPRGGGPMFTQTPAMMYAALLNAPTVQKDLNLTDDQKAKIKQAAEKSRAAMRELVSKMGNMGDATDEERAEMRKKMQAQQEESRKAVSDVLQPEQLKRLKEIALQRMGTGALSDKDVQKELKLTDEQIAKIKSIGEEAMKKMGELFSAGPGGDMDAMRKKMEEMRKDTEAKLTNVLTAEQKTALETMKGKKLDIPAAELRGGMGGGRRGGGGGAPPRMN
jgi:Spy/CpxP family protein refolding chaperone